MPHEYTRQRQGRDFSLHDYLTTAAAANRKNEETLIKAGEANKNLTERLEYYKEIAERSAAPVDGSEPPEKGRDLA